VTRHHRALRACILGALAPALVPAAADTPAVHVPGAETPPLLERLGPLDRVSALAVAPDLERAAVARLEREAPDARSRLTLHGPDGAVAADVELAGLFRDLLFDPGGEVVYGVLYKAAKKREGDTYLTVWDPSKGKVRRAVRLPSSARSVDYWTVRNALLVAARDELRTFYLPDLRSGPLFRVAGNNLAVSTVAGGDLVLVGQLEGLVLVNLTDPPGRFEMPIRGSARAPGPVVDVATSSDGTEALARLDDGRLFRVGFDPFEISESGRVALASLEGRDRTPEPEVTAAPPAPAPAPREPPPVSSEAAAPTADRIASDEPAAEREPVEPTEPLPAAEPVESNQPPAPPAPAEQADEEVPVEREEPLESTAATEPAAATPSPPREKPEPAPPADREVEPGDPSERGPRLQGRIEGPAAKAVEWVVLLGPDSIVREALRVKPAADGSWQAVELPPGRYRVQLDGGGGRVLVSDPPFLLLDVPENEVIAAPTIRVKRAL
jgi:hypothetical protein